MKKKLLISSVISCLLWLFLLPQASFAQEAREYAGNGFSFSLPTAYRLTETNLEGNLLVFASPYSTLKVYTQELGPRLSFHTYIDYGNYQLKLGKAGFEVISASSGSVNGNPVRRISFSRPVLTNLPNDKNFYLEAHVWLKQKNLAVTFWAKSEQAFFGNLNADMEQIVQTVSAQAVQTPAFIPPVTLPQDSPHIKYEGRQTTLDLPPGQLLWGRFYPGVPFYANSYVKMLESEAQLAHKFEFLMTYCTFPSDEPYPAAAVRKVYQDGRVLMLTLQPFTKALDWIAVPEFIEGRHDEKLKEWAKGLKELDEPVFVRPLNEMNGDWDPWCAWFFGKDTDLYIEAWRHIVDIFKEAGAANVYFVWNPHDRSFPDFTWNNPHLYYPGDDYVDWVGLTGYNNGTSHPADIWREFDEIYRPLYDEYLSRYPAKPFMITEFSCNEVGGDKAKWIERAFISLAQQNYPQIKIINWFDAQDNAWLYQIDSTPEAFSAFKNGLYRHKSQESLNN
ncbi:MAG: glycosyl hydrolase [Clostridia bacterium]|nr:glycosyl hydrolase [Clostridia bacterium]